LLKKDTSNVEALFNRAYAYNSLKEHTKAIIDLDKCIALGKKTSEVYYLRGVQYINLGNSASSCSDLDIAAKAGHEEAKKLYKMYCIK
jgi:tetratricopeptide (TPR) repeat protein